MKMFCHAGDGSEDEEDKSQRTDVEDPDEDDDAELAWENLAAARR